MTAWLALTVLGPVIVAVGHRWRDRSADARRRRQVGDALPEVVDLLIVVLGAGASVLQAVRWLAERGPAPAAPAFGRVVDQYELGMALTAALRSIPVDLDRSYRPMTTALIAATRDGIPTAELLLRLGDEARAARRRHRDRMARSLSVHLLFPLVTCSLPAVVVGAVLPLVLTALGRL